MYWNCVQLQVVNMHKKWFWIFKGVRVVHYRKRLYNYVQPWIVDEMTPLIYNVQERKLLTFGIGILFLFRRVQIFYFWFSRAHHENFLYIQTTIQQNVQKARRPFKKLINLGSASAFKRVFSVFIALFNEAKQINMREWRRRLLLWKIHVKGLSVQVFYMYSSIKHNM